jgi:hypothetical protein
VRQFGGGASNLTYSVRTPTHDLILRRPPPGKKARGAHDMGREYRIQAALKEPFGLVADMVALCQDDAVIGSEFYVMQRVDGLIPRRELPPAVDLDEAAVRRLCTGRPRRADPAASDRPRLLGRASARSGRAPATCGGRSRAGRTRFRNARTEDVGRQRIERSET